MEGCALFIVFLVAIGALVVAFNAISKLRAAQGDIKLLGTELAVLKRLVADLRRGAPAEVPEPLVVTPPVVTAPPSPRRSSMWWVPG